MSTMTLEELLRNAEDGELLEIYNELNSCVVPATGYAHAYCRKVNRMIDQGNLCINPTSYRKVYLPTLAKAILREMANRYANYCYHMKSIDMGKRHEDDEYPAKCSWCGEEFEDSELKTTDIGLLCDRCLMAIMSRGEKVTVYV